MAKLSAKEEIKFQGKKIGEIDDNFLINLYHMYDKEKNEDGCRNPIFFLLLKEVEKRDLDVGNTYKKFETKRKQRAAISSSKM